MRKQTELEKRVKALEEEITKLKAQPPVHHHHYNYPYPYYIYSYPYPIQLQQPYIPPQYPYITWCGGYQIQGAAAGNYQTYTMQVPAINAAGANA